MEKDEELDDALAEISIMSEKFDALTTHVDHLISWGDFLEQSKEDLQKMSERLSSIELMAESCIKNNGEIDIEFGLGVCWIGAVAIYEGHLHNLFLNALSVRSLQERISRFCAERIENKKPPRKGMKTATPEDIKEWLTERTITDPRKIAENFEEIFGIKTMRPDDKLCDHLLYIRNSFTHRGGGHKISMNDILEMTKYLNNIAIMYTTSLFSEVDKILQQDI
ncbi:hypothetical protein [Chromobacterium haemolyticum]|uniref:hypothetical protein n=1 Tax=Chromobacterium haemolyticum TaxID=394935 RepID=UPI001318C673|nr:hypothetical protein [Chromobacterium haemolyticum]BBH15063.1 hypothetical protein CH06BL_43110 [Chromobacterium haemolyticum]